MKTALLMAVGGAALLGGCASTLYGDNGDDGWGFYDRGYHSQYGNYDYNRNDPRYGGYYAENYYRDDSRYHERRLNEGDRVYRGRDNRYYCRRSPRENNHAAGCNARHAGPARCGSRGATSRLPNASSILRISQSVWLFLTPT